MTGCPSTPELEGLLDDRLSDTESRAVSMHVDSCPECQTALERLTQNALPLQSATAVSAVLPAALSQTDFLNRLKHHPPEKRNQPTRTEPGQPMVPGYEIAAELGRGGMGVVYKARQIGLNRPVALKMIQADSHVRSTDLERFRHEAEAVARLRHPNIIQIHDIGESDGRPYFALEYAESGSLANWLHGDPQPPVSSARLVETLARAVHHAHEHGIVHRDLKPANVLLFSRGSQKRGWISDPPLNEEFGPKITDFGLAKRIDETSDRTQNGEVVGTPSYMAPEQAAGLTRPIGPWTDIYSLGAILYELLTGRPPFKGATALDTVWQVLHEEPVRPSSLLPGLPRDIETICLKCLSKEPSRRYPSALALADDLKRFAQGKPITARPVGPLERAWKWARRKPTVAALIAGMFLVTLLGFAGITWQWREAAAARDAALEEKVQKEEQRLQAERARSEAELAQQQEVDQRKRARTALYYSRIAQSQLAWRVNDYASALEALGKCRPSQGQEDHRGWEWYYLESLYHSYLFSFHHGRAGSGGCVAYSPDGRRIASVVGGDPADETNSPAEVRVWDASSGNLIYSQSGPGSLHRLALGPKGARLALAGTDGLVLVWDVNTGKELLNFHPHDSAVSALVFSPDGTSVATAAWDRTVKVWDATTGQVRHQLTGLEARVQNVAFHPDGQRLALASWDGKLRLWDTQRKGSSDSWVGHKQAAYCVAFSPNGKLMVSAGKNGTLKVWEVSSRRTVQHLTGAGGAVLDVAWSPDGRYLAYGGTDETVRIWDFDAGVERIAFRGHTAPVEGVMFSPDGQRLVSCSPAEGSVKVWDLTRHPEHATFARTGADVEALAFDREGERFFSVTVKGMVQIWNGSTGELLAERMVPLSALTTDSDRVVSPAVMASFSPDALRVAGPWASDGRIVKVWSTTTGKELLSCVGHSLRVVGVRFSPDGRFLATAAADVHKPGQPHELAVWDTQTGEQKANWRGQGRLFTLAFSPDGRWLAWGAEAGMLGLVDWRSGETRMRKQQHKGNVIALSFSSDGRFLASAGVLDRNVLLWRLSETGAGRLKSTLPAPPLLCDLAFSPDGRRLAGVSRDLVKLWDVEAAQEVLELRGAPQRHFDAPFNPRVLFSPDGCRLVGTNWDESISVWEAELNGDRKRNDWPSVLQARRRQAADARASTWHLEEALHCLKHQNHPAAQFHLDRLRNVHLPGPLQARREGLLARMRLMDSPGK